MTRYTVQPTLRTSKWVTSSSREEYGTNRNFFRREKDGKEVEFKFTDLFGSERDTILNGFMTNLKVRTINEE